MSKLIVIQPGGYHPFHAGHAALYQSALQSFPNADVYVAATDNTKTRPFPFEIKEKLAKVAGVPSNRFVQVKSPFQAKEILQNYNPEEDIVVFIRSEKDKNEHPKPGGTKKDGSPAYFQPYTGKDMEPFSKHSYIAYLPTVEFGPGISSATEIRNLWPKLNDRRKLAMVMSLYPKAKENKKLAQNIVKMLDLGMGTEIVSESINNHVNNQFYVHRLSENKVVDYVRSAIIPEMRKYNVPSVPTENMYTVISSAIFENANTSTEVEEFLEQFRKLDQRKNIHIKVGSEVSILNLQLSSPDFATLFGFKTPKTITKIHREPTSNKIIQLEFDNNPDDVWPRKSLAKFNGKFITDSILLPNANSVDKALTMLNLVKPKNIKLRTSIDENAICNEMKSDKMKKSLYSTEQQADIIKELDNGYYLGDNSHDDDDGFVKKGYTVYYKEGPDQYRFVGDVNVSPYNPRREDIKKEVINLITNDKESSSNTKVNENSFNWSDYRFVEDMDVRLSITEAFFADKMNLTESNDPDTTTYFKSLVNMSDKIKVGKKCILVPLVLINNKVNKVQSPEIVKLISAGDERYTVKRPSGITDTYPKIGDKGNITFITMVFNKISSYNKFRTLIMMKFNSTLPDSDLFNSSSISSENKNNINEHVDYLPEK